MDRPQSFYRVWFQYGRYEDVVADKIEIAREKGTTFYLNNLPVQNYPKGIVKTFIRYERTD